MTSKFFYSVAAAVSAVVFNAAVATPAQAQTKAALTRDVDRSTAQPVHGKCSSTQKCTLYSVPAGKRLVIETVSYDATVSTYGIIQSVNFGRDPGPSKGFRITEPNVFLVAPVLAFQDSSGDRFYGGTQTLRIYLEENEDFAAAAAYTGFLRTQSFSFSGYLVDK